MFMDNTDFFIKVAFQVTTVRLGPEPLPESKGKSYEHGHGMSFWHELLKLTNARINYLKYSAPAQSFRPRSLAHNQLLCPFLCFAHVKQLNFTRASNLPLPQEDETMKFALFV